MNIIDTVKRWNLQEPCASEIAAYLNKVHEILCVRIDFVEQLHDDYFRNHSFEELVEDNKNFYKDVSENYHESYADPRFTRNRLPLDISDVASAFYQEVVRSIQFVFQKKDDCFQYILEKFLLFADVLPQGKNLVGELKTFDEKHQLIREIDDVTSTYYPHNFATSLLETQDFQDIRYLFRYGINISETEIAFAQFMNEYSKEDIQVLANQMVDGYVKGFERHHKHMNGRTNARIVLLVGLEQLAVAIQMRLHTYGYQGFIGGLVWQNQNMQAEMDFEKIHQYELQEADYQTLLQTYSTALKQYDASLRAYQGNVIMVSFGQVRKEVIDYESYYKPNYELKKIYELKKRQIFETYVPKAEISYTGMAFPVKEITNYDYPKIFKDVMKINQMDSREHEKMQAYLISILDQGDYVEIKGWKGNETDIRISLHELQNPEHETNFVNCGADVNIPAGEVYTSPQLQGSNGLLHLKQIRIAKVQFKDVKIHIEQGFTKDYTCRNTDDEEENHRLMESLIFHHRNTLPIGEFALGTNTYAYALAKKDGILHQLHTLIYEKLGPHIALGDTCFAWGEDTPLYDQNHKLVVAKDNEFSIQRKTDPMQAYVNMHYDLTIPYDEIGCIRVHTRDGKVITIVQDGKFVLAPLLPLNLYLSEETQ